MLSEAEQRYYCGHFSSCRLAVGGGERSLPTGLSSLCPPAIAADLSANLNRGKWSGLFAGLLVCRGQRGCWEVGGPIR